MAVTIQIDMERLNEPAVAKALANLLLAMGGVATSQALRQPAEAPAAAPAEATPQAAPAEAPTPRATEKAAKPAAKAAPKAAPKARSTKAEAKPAASAGTDAKDDGDLAQRYRDFVANLPSRSRKFLELVKRKGVVTIEDAMNELDISVPKAMGGITGSIGRWAPVRGVPVPYEATTRDGERIWRWIGSPIDGDDAAPAPAPKAEPKKAAKSRGKKGSTKKASGSKSRSTAKASAPATGGGDASARYREFVSNLPERSQKFIELVRERGTLTIGDAMDALGIDVPKAMGGITGSIGRWAPVRGVPVPYKATSIEGERAWEWVGGPGTEGGASPKAEAPAEVTPATATSEGAKQTPAKTEDVSPDPVRVDALIEKLPERSALFVRTLRQRGVLTMPEVLERFSLAKARAVSGIIDPIQRAAEELGMEVPFEATFAPTGDKAWLWPGSDFDASASEPMSTTTTTSLSPIVPADVGGDTERGRKAGRPGVRVRRRGT